MTATKYVASLRKGLKEAIEVIEALDSMTKRSEEFETEVLRPLRKVLKLKIPVCPACGKTLKLSFHCPQHE
jgi:tRNA(Ile2) C34 agmatinyltransferase TiaS